MSNVNTLSPPNVGAHTAVANAYNESGVLVSDEVIGALKYIEPQRATRAALMDAVETALGIEGLSYRKLRLGVIISEACRNHFKYHVPLDVKHKKADAERIRARLGEAEEIVLRAAPEAVRAAIQSVRAKDARDERIETAFCDYGKKVHSYGKKVHSFVVALRVAIRKHTLDPKPPEPS